MKHGLNENVEEFFRTICRLVKEDLKDFATSIMYQ